MLIKCSANHKYFFTPINKIPNTNTLQAIYNSIESNFLFNIISIIFILISTILVIFFHIYKEDISLFVTYIFIIIIIIFLNALSYHKNKRMIKHHNIDIIRLHKHMNELFEHLGYILKLLNSMDFNNDNNILLCVPIFSINYNQIQYTLKSYITILQNSIFTNGYKHNVDLIIYKIINHHNFIIGDYKLQQHIINNYQNKQLHEFFKDHSLHKYWVIASVLNLDILSEYKEYFDMQATYMQFVNISITQKHIDMYHNLVKNKNNIKWIFHNLGDILLYYDIKVLYKHFYQLYNTDPILYAHYISELVMLNHIINVNLIKCFKLNKIGFWQYISLIFKKLPNKYPFITELLEINYKNNTNKIQYYILSFIQNLYQSLFEIPRNKLTSNPQFETLYTTIV